MPNYKLPPSLREHMVKRAAELAANRVAIAHQDFPMNYEEFQDALMPGAQRKTIKKLISDGVDTFYQSPAVKFVLPKVHGIERTAGVTVVAPKLYYFKMKMRAEYSYQCTISDSELLNSDYYIDTSVLSPEKQQALGAWVNNSVRERRVEAITSTVVKWFLEKGVAPVEHITAAHIMARWPTIATLATERYHRERFREVPPKLDRWGWQPNDPEYAKRRNMIKVADMVLISASMLPEFEPAKDQLVAAVNNYEKFPGEKF